MCGIIGYVGPRQASDVLLDGLKRLEYRGYDSAGLVVQRDGDLQTVKCQGKVHNLADLVAKNPCRGQIGIAHTRWATHGAPSEANAHPHLDCRGRIAVVHNGIIENYEALKRGLTSRGHQFRSETDTEILAHLIEEYASKMPILEALTAVLKDAVGTMGLAVITVDEPGKIYAARVGNPLVIGLGTKRDEFFIASDPTAIIPYTRDVIYLDDGDLAVLTESGVETYSLDRVRRDKKIESIQWTPDQIERGKYPHFMLKEMFEQPRVVNDCLRGRSDLATGRAVLGGLQEVAERLRTVERLIILGCGSAHYAGLVGARMLEEYAEIPTECHLASEWRYRRAIVDPVRQAAVAVSQSGETADTLGALREAKNRGLLTLGVVNAVGSTVARETDAGVFVHAGPEVAVASTKAFLAQITAFSLMTVWLGRQRRMSAQAGARILEETSLLPAKIEKILQQSDRIRALARKWAHASGFFFLGRQYNAPTALEGALKLKEISYIHAEGVPAGELKHGPIALLDRSFPVVALATRDGAYVKMKSNIEEAKARGAPIIAVVNEGDEEVVTLADDIIYVPRTIEMLSPILNAVPLQLFAYHMAVARGLDPDKPRNLAKSVTVE